MSNYAVTVFTDRIDHLYNSNGQIDTSVSERYDRYGQLEPLIVFQNEEARYTLIGGFDSYHCLVANNEENAICIVVPQHVANKIILDQKLSLAQVSKNTAPIHKSLPQTVHHKTVPTKKNDFYLLGDLSKPQEKYTLELEVEIILGDEPEIISIDEKIIEKQEIAAEATIDNNFEKDTEVPIKIEDPVVEEVHLPDVSKMVEILDPAEINTEPEEETPEEIANAMADLQRELMGDIEDGLLPDDFPFEFEEQPQFVEPMFTPPPPQNKLKVNKPIKPTPPQDEPEIAIFYENKVLSYFDKNNAVRDEIGVILLRQAAEQNFEDLTTKDFKINGHKEGLKIVIKYINYSPPWVDAIAPNTIWFPLDKIYEQLIIKFHDNLRFN